MMIEKLKFEEELRAVINRHSKENSSNTPDFILAQYLLGCLNSFDTAVQQRETWYGRDARPNEIIDHIEQGKDNQHGLCQYPNCLIVTNREKFCSKHKPSQEVPDIRGALENLIDDHHQHMERGTHKDWVKILDKAVSEISRLTKPRVSIKELEDLINIAVNAHICGGMIKNNNSTWALTTDIAEKIHNLINGGKS